MVLRCLITFVLLLFLPGKTCPAFAHQQLPESSLEDPLDEMVFEKAYLHLDRFNYVSGEDIWYKAYLVDGKWNTLTGHSWNLYVELISPGLDILDRQLIRLEAGTGAGDFHLPDTLPSGIYLLRAYTNWMKNFGADFMFHREISINHPDHPVFTSQNSSPGEKDGIDLQFFPEGGSLVAGVPTKVGFKAVDANGNGCGIKGLLVTMEGDACARFESTHLGMGSFNLTPAKGTAYRAVIDRVQGPALEYDLPRVREKGYVLNVDDGEGDDLIVIVKTNRKTLSSKDTLQVYLEVKTSKGSFLSKLGLTHTAQSIVLPKGSFPPGIAHLILYDADFKPHSERLVCLDPPLLRIQIERDKQVYHRREKTVLKVRVTDENGGPVDAEMSLSAFDAVALAGAGPDPSNVCSYLWLESELRGNVENPGYYFNEAHADRYGKLDLLLMTQGWRDFVWKY